MVGQTLKNCQLNSGRGTTYRPYCNRTKSKPTHLDYASTFFIYSTAHFFNSNKRSNHEHH